MRFRVIAFTAVAAAVGACGGPNVNLPVAASLEVDQTTDAQSAFAGSRLALPLAAYARASEGSPVTGARVRWSALQGAAFIFSDTMTVSDGNGRVEVSVVLPPAAGSYAVRGELVDTVGIAVTFTVVALAPPVLSGVLPATFRGGDTVAISGTALSDTIRIEIGNADATVLAATPTQLSAIVPPCREPGSVTILGRFGGGTTNTISGTFQASSSPVVLGVGEWTAIDPSAVGTCASFPTAGASGAEYLLAPQSTTSTPDVTVNYRLSGDSVVTVIAARPRPAAPVPAAVRFHNYLRSFEAATARTPLPSTPPPAPLAAAADIQVGDRRSFEVCNVVTCQKRADFTKVTAEARFVGTHAAIYHDLNAPAGGFGDQDFFSIGVLFDEELYDIDTRAFGAESDVDQNGRVIILMTPVVNGLTPKSDCETAITTGFFFSLDIDPTFQGDARSNHGEVFYAITPDIGGSVSCALTTTEVLRLVPVTFAHEFQHMISYNQHRLLRGGSTEVLWLNEGLSHLAEELTGQYFLANGDLDRFSLFTQGDLFDAYQYLSATGAYPVETVQGTGTLPERGAIWLFLRWMVDQFGTDITRRLDETSLTGAENIVAAVGEPFDQLLSQWFLANYVSDLPDFAAPQRLRYITWPFRTVFASLHAQRPDRFALAFPVQPSVYPGGTFDVTSSFISGSGEFFRIAQAAGQRGFTLQLRNPSGGALGPNGQPRLGVIRIR